MKKYIFGAVLFLGILASPALTQAAGLTGSQIQAILTILSSFGVDQSVINNVSIALNGGTQQQSSNQTTQTTQTQQQSTQTTQSTQQQSGGQCTFGKLYASPYADVGSSIEPTSDGGYILGGSTNFRYEGGQYYDLLLAKLDANGAVNWQKIYGNKTGSDKRIAEMGSGFSALFHAVPAPDGGYLAATNISNTIYDNQGLIVKGMGDDLLLIKTDASGAVQWQKSYGRQDGGKNHQYPLFLQNVPGGYIVAGQTWKDNFQNVVTDSFWSTFVTKVDDQGNIVWQKRLGTQEGAKFTSFAQAPDGGYLLTVSSEVSVEGLGYRVGGTVITKLDASGNIQWTKAYVTKTDWVSSPTADGGAIVVGRAPYYAPGTTYLAAIDVYKLDSSGAIQWGKEYLSNAAGAFDQPDAVKQTPDGGYAVLGDTRDDILLLKLNEGGDITWQKVYSSGPVWSSIGEEDPADFTLTPDGGYAIVGKTDRYEVLASEKQSGGNTSDILAFKVDASGNIAFSASGWSAKDTNLTASTPLVPPVPPKSGGVIVADSFDLSPSSFSANASDATLNEKDLSQGTCGGTTTTTPSITVLSPNGGEQFALGSTQSIKWSTQNFGASNVRINLQKNDVYLMNLFDSTANDGTEAWTVPADLAPGNDYKIIIRKYDDLSNVYDKSDAAFSIVAPSSGQPVFSISPANVQKGSGMSVTASLANAAPNAQVKIYCRDPNNQNCDDSASYGTDSSGKFSITYPPTIISGLMTGTYTSWLTVNGVQSNTATLIVAPTSTAQPVFTITPNQVTAGATITDTVVNGAPNATVKIYCRTQNNQNCDDSASYITDSNGRFTHSYNTAGWTAGTYTSWVTVNGVQSNTATFTVTGNTIVMPCIFNGQSIANGSSVTAYQASSVSYGSQCVQEIRTCNNGILSGTYTNTQCTIASMTEKIIYQPPSQHYAYAPAAIRTSDALHVWACYNRDAGNFTDYILHVSNGASEIVLSPTAGAWDSRHTCDPSVTRGVFTYQGHAYPYALFYLGTDKDFGHNQIGVAYSNSLVSPEQWVKYPLPLVSYPDDGTWGVGQPSATSIANGRVLLFYTKNGNAFVREIDLGDADHPNVGAERPLTTAGAQYLNGGQDLLRNLDLAYDPTRDVFFAVRDQLTSGSAQTYPNYITPNINLSWLSGTSVWGGGGSWTSLTSITPAKTGYPRNHNASIVRSEYGTLPDPQNVEVLYSTSCSSDTSASCTTAEWSYHISSLTIPVTVSTATSQGLSKPILISPVNNAVGISSNPSFSWNAVSGASGYWLDVTDDPSFSNWWSIYASGPSASWNNGNGVLNGHYPGITAPQTLIAGKTYYGRVYVFNTSDQLGGVFSDVSKFSIVAPIISTAQLKYYGVHSWLDECSDLSFTTHVANIKNIGANVSRNHIYWDKVEPVQGQFNWQQTDDMVNKLTASGIEPLIAILTSPPWSKNMCQGGSSPCPPYPSEYVPTDDAQFATWLDYYKGFVRTVVQRYKGKVRLWELWNEPNLGYTWRVMDPATSPSRIIALYSRWASVIQQVIKQEDPSAQVAAGSLTILDSLPPYATGAIPIPGKVFLQGMYNNGFYPDVVSVHPYANGNEPPDQYAASNPANSFMDVETIRNVMVSNGQQDKPIWITEFGWKIWPGTLSEDQQAQYLKRAFEIIRDQWSYVKIAVWFWDYDRVCRNWFNGGANGYGLFRMDGTMRPSGAAFRGLFGQISSATGPKLGPSDGTSQTASVFSAVNGLVAGNSVSTAPTTTFTYVWNRDLQIGSPYSDDITALQKALTLNGEYSGELTGGFYNQTYTAVKAFQEKYGIHATGYVGPFTRAELNTLFAR